MSSSSTHCVANKRQSLIGKGFAKSRRQIYELIGLHYKICRIASLWYLFNSVFITNFSHTRSKASLNRANLKKRLGLRFTKIRKRPVIGERKCRLCLTDVRGGEMNAWQTNPNGRLRGGYRCPCLFPGGYSHTLPIRVCAAQRGRDFEAPDLERGIHFRGVF